MNDKLYNEFYDPSDDFLEEPRAFCYEIASQLIGQAKHNSWGSWYESDYTIKGILLLLYTWNFASPITKSLTIKTIRQLMERSKKQLKSLEEFHITDADEKAWKVIKPLFDQFSKLFGQTGASKALSLLNPELFVMWDTGIRKRLNRELIKGIGNGNSGDSYVIFLKGIQRIIKDYALEEKLPHNVVLAKKIDEYHYVRIVMKKKVRVPAPRLVKTKLRSGTPINPHIRITLSDNLRGRSIHEKVIPTVCNLKNMLRKLIAVNGDISLMKPWEKRSYNAYLIEKVKPRLFTEQEDWIEILRNHILHENPLDLGASCIDIYLVAYVAVNFNPGKERFFQFIKEEGISQKDGTAQAIWQVGKGDGEFLEILNSDGTIKDPSFFKKWINGNR